MTRRPTQRRAAPIAPARKPAFWIVAGTDDAEAWAAHAAARVEAAPAAYRSATFGTIGFFRRSRLPPGSPPPSDGGARR